MEKKLRKTTLLMLMSLLAATIAACDRGGSGTSGTMEAPRDADKPKSDTAPATPAPPVVAPPPASSGSTSGSTPGGTSGGTSGGASGSATSDSSGNSSEATPDTYGSPQSSERSSGTSSLEKSVSSDASITTKVKAALINDSKIKGHDIQVDTQRGEVVLSGMVDSRAQIEEAMKVATGIDGVKKVTNQLKTKSTQ